VSYRVLKKLGGNDVALSAGGHRDPGKNAPPQTCDPGLPASHSQLLRASLA